MQAGEAGRAAQHAREEVVELQMAAQAKDRENAKLWDQARRAACTQAARWPLLMGSALRHGSALRRSQPAGC